jgi:hypothetical protein
MKGSPHTEEHLKENIQSEIQRAPQEELPQVNSNILK